METSELISNLTRDVPPVPRHAVLLRLAAGLAAGTIVSFLIMWAWLGIRPDLANAAATSAYWMKFFYTLAFAVFGLWATERLSRPAMRVEAPLIGLLLVFLLLFGIASMQLMHAPPVMRPHMVMGNSSRVCPWRILALSLPVFAGLFWSLRALAPTRLVLAGAIAGFAAGAWGAWIYAFHCDESAAPFVLVFYTLSIALVGALGAIIARRVLRW